MFFPLESNRLKTVARPVIGSASVMKYFVLSALCFGFVFVLSGCSSNSVSDHRVVISVGDQSITVEGVKRIVKITSHENGVPESIAWASMESLVGRIVNNRLILEYGRDEGISLAEIDLERAIQEIVKDYPGVSFKETLLTACIDYDEWKEKLRERLLIKKIVKKQSECVAPITYDDIASYYKEKEDDFHHPERVKFIHVMVKTEDEAEAALSCLKEGEGMAGLAREQSVYHSLQEDCVAHWKTRAGLPASLSEKVFSIPIGEVSDIFTTEYGYHIVKVMKREQPGRKELFEVMGEIEAILLGKAREERYTAWLKELTEKYAVNVDYALIEKIRTANESN